MAYQGVIVRNDGSLYCDISIETLGLMSFTPLCSLPITYEKEKFVEMGEIFVKVARSTCPVDTGFLRDHNDYASDAGGIEMWSEATYSAYQEYGTSRCRAQPWFESSIQTALAESGIEDEFRETQTKYCYIDGQLAEIQAANPTSLGECYYWIERIEQLEVEMASMGLFVEGLAEALDEMQAQIEWMEAEMMAQMMMGAMGGGADLSWIEQMIIDLIVGMISALIRSIFDNLFADLEDTDANPHHPSHA